MNVDQIKQALVGDWTSIAPEVRPSAAKNPDWTLKPFYLKRDFKYLADDRFQLNIVNSAEPYGKVPLARILIKGSPRLNEYGGPTLHESGPRPRHLHRSHRRRA